MTIICQLFLFLLPVFLFFSASPAHALASDTDLGWDALIENADQTAVTHFRNALQENPDDERAILGLSFAYGLRLDDAASWNAYRSFLDKTADPNPYIYAAQNTRWFSVGANRKGLGLRAVLRNTVSHPDPNGILRVICLQYLGQLAERDNQLREADSYYSEIGALTKWRIIGPFHNISGSGFDKVFEPELVDNPDAEYKGSDLRTVRWFTPHNIRRDCWTDIARHFSTVQGVFYARTYVHSPTTQSVQMRIGTSGAFRLFLNQQMILDTIEERNNDVDTYIAEVTLQAGWNQITVKLCNSKLDRCNFLLRITDKSGTAISDLEYSTAPQQFPTSTTLVKPLDHPFLAFFRSQIAKFPNRPENYLLLANALLRNDEVDEAEEIISKLLSKYPNFICALMLALETNQRANRYDESITTIEHITNTRPDLPISLVYSFNRAVSTKQLDTADAILNNIGKTLPESNDYYEAAIELARLRNDVALVSTLQAKAFETNPQILDFASAAAMLALRTGGGYAKAIDIIKAHLSYNWNEGGLLMKAALCEDAMQYADWENTYNELFELSPLAPGFHSRMADSYAARRKWDAALKSITLALEDAPGVSWMWQQSGIYRKALSDSSGAGSDFKQAIATDPANFSARELLRELTNTPSPFSVMQTNNIDSLIRTSPSATDYPDKQSVTLLLDKQRVVYDGSRCKVRFEMLVRVLNNSGIDSYKEVTLPGGDNTIVEKAVVIKANGREIPADRNGNYAVFKNLEPNDFIYGRINWSESTQGELAGYFFDEFGMNDYVPSKIVRYSLLTQKSERYSWNFVNGEVQQYSKDTPLGNLQVWELRDQPAITEEEDMPSYGAIGKILYISSVPRWQEIVQWYYNIARTKTRSSLDVRTKMNELFPPGKQYTKQEIIEGVYHFITTNIRYSNVPFRQSGVVPQTARDVLVTRIGDCKDVATLCISMLAERGVTAYHALVRTNSSPLRKQPLPSIPFDHDIVYTELDGKPLFMDLTAENVPLYSLPFGDLEALCLVIRPGESTPSLLQKQFFTPNVMRLNTNLSIHDDLGAEVTQQYWHSGARTEFYRSAWKTLGPTEVERSIREGLSNDWPDVQLEDYSINHLDTILPEIDYTLHFSIPDFVMEAEGLRIIKLPWYSPFEPLAALGYSTRTHPYEFSKYVDTLVETITINIPDGYEAIGLTESEHFVGPVSYVQRTARQSSATLTLSRTAVFQRNYVMPEEYANFKTYYGNVARSDRQALLLVPKGTVIQRVTPGKVKVPKGGRKH